MFTGLCAFPLTPVTGNGVDEASFMKILSRLTTRGSILWGFWARQEVMPT
jgi:dihydrodipicolinate synthase/N-acetylneuraminate lyase